jgi:hypothetical protein
MARLGLSYPHCDPPSGNTVMWRALWRLAHIVLGAMA